jgi:hypothetical protein
MARNREEELLRAGEFRLIRADFMDRHCCERSLLSTLFTRGSCIDRVRSASVAVSIYALDREPLIIKAYLAVTVGVSPDLPL